MEETKQGKIYALFSVENDYNQPDNNLVAWWHHKPNLEQLASALGLKFPHANDDITLSIVKIWSGAEGARIDNTDYSLCQIGPGKVQ